MTTLEFARIVASDDKLKATTGKQLEDAFNGNFNLLKFLLEDLIERVADLEEFTGIPKKTNSFKVRVVDGNNGTTKVKIPRIGQVLFANVILKDGAVIPIFPVNPNVSYKWFLKDASETVLGTSGVYTVNHTNLGKILCVAVTYEGVTVIWEAVDVVPSSIEIDELGEVHGNRPIIWRGKRKRSRPEHTGEETEEPGEEMGG